MQRVGVIGVGTMGGVHSGAYAAMPGAQLAAVADIRKDAAEKTAERSGAQAFDSLETMLDSADLDVVDICVPTPWHREYVLKAAAAGKHIVCEKPLARSLSDCDEIISTCQKAGVRLFVAHVVRFFPEFVRMKALVETGAVGQPAVVRTSRGGSFPKATNNWYANFEWSGGAVLDLIIHDFDWLRWCFGEVDRVFAKGLYTRGIPETDYALVTLHFKNEVIAHVEGTWAFPGGFRVIVEIAGDQGLIEYDSRQAVPLRVARKEAAGGGGGVALPESPLARDPYSLELEHFIHCLETGEEASISPHDARQAVSVALAALESIRTGRPVTPV